MGVTVSERAIRRLRNLGPIVAGGVLGVVLTVAVGVAASWPRSAVVYRSRQPSTVAYQDGAPHYLGLIRDRSTLAGESYHLMIGRDPSLSYGHRIRVDTAMSVAVGSIEWRADGVRVRFTTGHELFVPARYFTFGR
ncbi:hypothetical protein [Actinoallomurus sp. CA-150999]|uniref:hypothetical protein n=1 Tax=Actinoallomurus sp. CA-150999 TaxID=3239887 RepID=UPI003D8FFF63